jgi:thiol-disulfide isomerase/thioredoxin
MGCEKRRGCDADVGRLYRVRSEQRLSGANGVADRLEKTLLQLAPDSHPQPTLQPVAQPVTTSAMPSLEGGTGWLNGDPVTPASLKGKVVLIDFWTWDCINCQHTLPHVQEWANKYQAQGLVVIGVHTPEYPWEKPWHRCSRPSTNGNSRTGWSPTTITRSGRPSAIVTGLRTTSLMPKGSFATPLSGRE